MVDLGSPAHPFSLPDTEGGKVSSSDFAGAPGLLVIFMCNHCPYVKHVRAGLAALTREYAGKGIAIVGINSNDAEKYPEDRPEKMKLEKNDAGYVFPYLFDATQTVAKDYGATCTPDFFLYDKSQKLVYRGQLDDSRPGNGVPVTGRDLRSALDAVLEGRPPSPSQKPSIGCNIKWKL